MPRSSSSSSLTLINKHFAAELPTSSCQYAAVCNLRRHLNCGCSARRAAHLLQLVLLLPNANDCAVLKRTRTGWLIRNRCIRTQNWGCDIEKGSAALHSGLRTIDHTCSEAKQ